ncbi:DNA helicase Pif1-like protein [Artemisia annua]|uniref:DNA helicase Pif1-like protein n=1 Tax=Artemisia annua TaxID=35608 RepID=A0A2U1PHD4_ARTAN|nr:DNA helicase Pif1-like protein [Artemisia annua]
MVAYPFGDLKPGQVGGSPQYTDSTGCSNTPFYPQVCQQNQLHEEVQNLQTTSLEHRKCFDTDGSMDVQPLASVIEYPHEFTVTDNQRKRKYGSYSSFAINKRQQNKGNFGSTTGLYMYDSYNCSNSSVGNDIHANVNLSYIYCGYNQYIMRTKKIRSKNNNININCTNQPVNDWSKMVAYPFGDLKPGQVGGSPQYTDSTGCSNTPFYPQVCQQNQLHEEVQNLQTTSLEHRKCFDTDGSMDVQPLASVIEYPHEFTVTDNQRKRKYGSYSSFAINKRQQNKGNFGNTTGLYMYDSYNCSNSSVGNDIHANVLNQHAASSQHNIPVSHSTKDQREHLYYHVKGKGLSQEGNRNTTTRCAANEFTMPCTVTNRMSNSVAESGRKGKRKQHDERLTHLRQNMMPSRPNCQYQHTNSDESTSSCYKRKSRRTNKYTANDESTSCSTDVSPLYIDLGDCSWRCEYCNAAFWFGERLKRAPKNKLYIYDTVNEVANRMNALGGNDKSNLSPQIVQQLIQILDEHNELVQIFRTARDKCGEANVPEFKVQLYNVVGAQQYNLPSTGTLGAIVFESGADTRTDFDVIVEYRDRGPYRINKLHSSYMSLQFPLLFVYGQPGYNTDLTLQEVDPNKKRKKLSMNAYYTYQLHERFDEMTEAYIKDLKPKDKDKILEAKIYRAWKHRDPPNTTDKGFHYIGCYISSGNNDKVGNPNRNQTAARKIEIQNLKYRELYNLRPPLQIIRRPFQDKEKEKVRNRVPLAILLQENPKTHSGVRFTCDGIITSINTTREWYYVSCNTCSNKLDDDEGIYKCSTHGPMPSPTYRYNFKVYITDGSETMMLTCFTPKADAIIGTDCNSLVNSLNNPNPKEFPEKIRNIVGQKHIFQFHFNITTTQAQPNFILNEVLDKPSSPLQLESKPTASVAPNPSTEIIEHTSASGSTSSRALVPIKIEQETGRQQKPEEKDKATTFDSTPPPTPTTSNITSKEQTPTASETKGAKRTLFHDKPNDQKKTKKE